jgi:branched-chain amino acid transport system ATP-binding protein
MTGLALRTEDLHAGYGEVRVLQGVTLEVPAGSITAVVGANGAGKTTLMRALAGLIQPTAGRIVADGADITGLPIHRRVAAGIALVPEGRLIFPDLSVDENLRLGAATAHARSGADATLRTVRALFPRLAERAGQAGGTLSGGEQQMLALGRGLMAQPRLLLLDEPTLGLAPAIARQIFQVVPQLRALGTSVLIAEQDVRRTLRMADRAYVLQNGRIAAEGTGAEIMGDPGLRRAYLGHD